MSHIYGADVDVLADLGAGFRLEVAAGYLNEWLNGGPHWVITPVHKMPEVAPESGTVALSYFKPLSDSYTFTARLENSYTGPRYSIFFSNPYEFTGTYRPMPGYDLINVRAGVKFRETWTATLFVNNLINKHAQLESMFTENEPQPSFTRIRTNQPLTGRSRPDLPFLAPNLGSFGVRVSLKIHHYEFPLRPVSRRGHPAPRHAVIRCYRGKCGDSFRSIGCKPLVLEHLQTVRLLQAQSRRLRSRRAY